MVAPLMPPIIRQFSFALVLVATLGSRAVTQSSSLEPQQGVLALRSGGVIEGRFSKLGDQYVVVVHGGEIRIDADKVEVACRSIDEAYILKRAGLSHHSVSSHLRLAEWCIRHKLFEQAEGEIDTARVIDEGDRRIALAQRRLQAVLQQEATASQTANEPVPAPDHGELEGWLDGLPRESVEQFAHTIQPLLSNRCATGACHGPTSGHVDVHVLRVPRGRTISRRVTARNLREVMKWVDRAQPEDSPLLAVPTRPHASSESAIFATSGDDQYRRLVDWVYSLSQQPVDPVPSGGGQETARPFAVAPVMRSPWGTTSPLLQPTPLPWRTTPRVGPGRTPVHHALAERRQALEEEAAKADAEVDRAAIDESPGDDRRRAQKRGEGESAREAGTESDGYIPVDEFDPEIFNRRHPAPTTEDP
jgi:hypothetical protein